MTTQNDHCIQLPEEFADCGSLQKQTLSKLRELLLREAGNATSALSVSLRRIQNCGASFVGILIQTHKHLQQSGRQLKLCDVGHEVQTVLDTCGTRFGPVTAEIVGSRRDVHLCRDGSSKRRSMSTLERLA